MRLIYQHASKVASGILLSLMVLPALSADSSPDFRGPDITIVAGVERTVYEYRQNGHLRMIRIVPKIGPAYYLVPRDHTKGFGDLEQADMLIPNWVIVRF